MCNAGVSFILIVLEMYLSAPYALITCGNLLSLFMWFSIKFIVVRMFLCCPLGQISLENENFHFNKTFSWSDKRKIKTKLEQP